MNDTDNNVDMTSSEQQQQVDPTFEFEAPQFCDFLSGGFEEDSIADNWFDQKLEQENVNVNCADEQQQPPQPQEDVVMQDVEEEEEEEEPTKQEEEERQQQQTVEDDEPKQQQQTRPKICGGMKSSFNVRNVHGELVPPKKAKRAIKSVRRILTVPKAPHAARPIVPRRSRARTVKTTTASRTMMNKDNKREQQQPRRIRSNSAAPRKSISILATTHTKTSLARYEAMKKRRENEANAKKSSGGATRVTVPMSPHLRTKRSHSTKRRRVIATSEETELDMIQKEREAMKQRRQQNASKMREVLESVGQVLPTRSTKALTEPHEFKFFTGKRARSSSVSASSSSQTPRGNRFAKKTNHHVDADRPKSAQPRSRKSNRRTSSVTEPQPFNFASTKRSRSVTVKPHEPDMKKITQILRVLSPTPSPRHSNMSKKKSKLTEPTSPTLHTKKRHRSSSVMSREAKEAKDMAEIPQFKARKVDEKILHSRGDIGVPKVAKAQLTNFRAFRLRTNERGAKKPKATHEEFDRNFKALPLKGKVLYGDTNLPFVEKAPITTPISPPIRKTRRKSSIDNESVKVKPFKARPIPKNVLCKLTTTSRKSNAALSVPKPFNLRTEERGEKHQSALMERLEREKQEENARREFMAQPLLEVDYPIQPEPSHRELTQPKPFALHGTVYSERARERLEREYHQQLLEEHEKTKFRAQPLRIKQPFMIKKSKKPVTEIQSFGLQSNQRAEKRRQFDEEQQRKAEEHERSRLEQEKKREALEREEIKEMRKQMVHKARPIIQAFPEPIKKSDAPLTEPVSPQLETAKRQHSRVNSLASYNGDDMENQPIPNNTAW